MIYTIEVPDPKPLDCSVMFQFFDDAERSSEFLGLAIKGELSIDDIMRILEKNSALPDGWRREEVIRSLGGTILVMYRKWFDNWSRPQRDQL